MVASGLFLGFGLPGYSELMLLLVLGLLLFGRNLPQVGKQVARTIMEFKKGLRDLRDQIDRDEDLRDVRATLDEVKSEVKGTRDMARLPDLRRDSKQLFDNLTDPDLASPGPDSEFMPPIPEQGVFEQAALDQRVERQEPGSEGTGSEAKESGVEESEVQVVSQQTEAPKATPGSDPSDRPTSS